MVYVKSIWRSFISIGPALGISLILLIGIPRFWLVLSANVSGSYSQVSFIFLSMALIPFVLLNKPGRQLIGIRRPTNPKWLIWSFLLGISMCIILYISGTLLYENSLSNWFTYISKSYPVTGEELQNSRFTYFIIFALTSMTISPVAEELMYRGIIHESFAIKYGDNRASQIDSLAFALTHLAHFGIIYDGSSWKFLAMPAVLWVVLMYITSRIFFVCRVNSGSILGAILCHSGVNLAMIYFIFYHIL